MCVCEVRAIEYLMNFGFKKMNLDGWKLEREIWVFEIVTNYVISL